MAATSDQNAATISLQPKSTTPSLTSLNMCNLLGHIVAFSRASYRVRIVWGGNSSTIFRGRERWIEYLDFFAMRRARSDRALRRERSGRRRLRRGMRYERLGAHRAVSPTALHNCRHGRRSPDANDGKNPEGLRTRSHISLPSCTTPGKSGGRLFTGEFTGESGGSNKTSERLKAVTFVSFRYVPT